MSQLPFDSGAVLVVDKPLNWTSFDVVKKIRYEICKHYSLKKIKVGNKTDYVLRPDYIKEFQLLEN